VLWAGSQLLAWGGCDPAAEGSCETTTDGFGFDPATRGWMRLEDAPLGGTYADVIWTGKEAVFLLRNEHQLEGQAYDPVSDTWRMIASGPIGLRKGAVSVWTGSEVIVWGEASPRTRLLRLARPTTRLVMRGDGLRKLQSG
jgi:N-acetylneuraminic acid mutarotase